MKCRDCKKFFKREDLVVISLLWLKGKRMEQKYCPECGAKLIWSVVEAKAC